MFSPMGPSTGNEWLAKKMARMWSGGSSARTSDTGGQAPTQQPSAAGSMPQVAPEDNEFKDTHLRPVTSVDPSADSGWHRTARGGWVEHAPGEAPAPHPDAQLGTGAALASAGNTFGKGASSTGKAVTKVLKKPAKLLTALSYARWGAKKVERHGDQAANDLEAMSGSAQHHADSVGLGDHASPLTSTASQVASGMGALTDIAGDVASELSPGISQIKSGVKIARNAAVLAQVGGNALSSATQELTDRRRAADHAAFLNSAKGSKEINDRHSAVAHEIRDLAEKGELKATNHGHLDPLLERDAVHTSKSGAVQGNADASLTAQFIADQNARKAGTLPAEPEHTGDFAPQPSHGPHSAEQEAELHGKAPDLWTGRKPSHQRAVVDSHLGSDIDPTARQYVPGDERTKHLRSPTQYLKERPAKFANKLKSPFAKDVDSTAPTPALGPADAGHKWEKSASGSWDATGVSDTPGQIARKQGTWGDLMQQRASKVAGGVRLGGKILAGKANPEKYVTSDPAKAAAIAGASTVVEGGKLAAAASGDALNIGGASLGLVGRGLMSGGKRVQNATKEGAARQDTVDKINRLASSAGKVDQLRLHQKAMDELTASHVSDSRESGEGTGKAYQQVKAGWGSRVAMASMPEPKSHLPQEPMIDSVAMNRLFRDRPQATSMQASGEATISRTPQPVVPREPEAQTETANSVTEKLARPQPATLKARIDVPGAEKAPAPTPVEDPTPAVESAQATEHLDAPAPFEPGKHPTDYRAPLDRLEGKGTRKGLSWLQRMKGKASRAMQAIPRGFASLKQRLGLGLGPVDPDHNTPHVGELPRKFDDGGQA